MNRTSYLVLSVDDDPGDQEMLRRYFSKIDNWNVEIVGCETPEMAIAEVRRRRFDVILLDHQLGRHSGLALLDQLAGSSASRFQPVIMITGRGDEVLAVEAIKSGAVDYIPKRHLSAATLRNAVQNAVTKAAMREELERQRVELERLARVDDLTGLLNRRAFDEALELETLRAIRFGLPLSLAMIDLDHFKQVNDRFGHVVGDEVLRRTGEAIRGGTRAIDSACRWGGEEFAILLSGVGLEGAFVFGERIRETIRSQTYQSGDAEAFRVTCSIGLARLDPTTHALSQLVETADRALYKAKTAGRDQTCS